MQFFLLFVCLFLFLSLLVYSFVPSFRAKRAAKEAKEAQALPAPVSISSPRQLDSFPGFQLQNGSGNETLKSVNLIK